MACLVIVLVISAVTVTAVVGQEYIAGSGVKNVIFFIGDGMGYEVITTTRLLTVGKDGRLWMETSKAVAIVRTYSANSLVTDSAAAGTALATGYKTNNAVISMTPPPELKPLKTILEAAKEREKSTGLVTTVTITHATPACFAAHTDSREELPIADQYAENKNVDVLLGGGRQFFIPKSWSGSRRTDERNLIEEFEDAGYAYVKTAAELKATTAKKILGLFALGALDYAIDREEKPSEQPTLAEMTKKAIEVLSKNPKGFFLMVEGGKIDWACHGHDPATAVADTSAFDEAVKTALTSPQRSRTL